MAREGRPKPRHRVRRVPDRARYDRETIDAILDAAPICHLGLIDDGGHPVVIPTLHARVGNDLFLHGSAASRMIRTSGRSEVCVTATLVDGYVLARSVFHHSINYRSVVMFGDGCPVSEEQDKRAALHAFTEKLLPGRWEDARPPTSQELKGTGVVRVPIEEATAKVRTGGPVDEPEDYDLPVWAGTIPLATTASEPVSDDRLQPGVEPPGYVRDLIRRHA